MQGPCNHGAREADQSSEEGAETIGAAQLTHLFQGDNVIGESAGLEDLLQLASRLLTLLRTLTTGTPLCRSGWGGQEEDTEIGLNTEDMKRR